METKYAPIKRKVEDYDREISITPHKYDFRADQMNQSIWDAKGFPSQLDERELLAAVLEQCLSANEQIIIQKLFWECLSEDQVADLFNVSRRTIRGKRDQILKKIKKCMENPPPDLHKDEGVEELSAEEQRLADIRNVYESEIYGSYLGGSK